MPPWQPSWSTDRRFDAATTTTLINNYIAALDIRRKAHEMGAIFGGKMPIAATYVPGGITTVPNATQKSKFRAYLTEIIKFITDRYIPDVERVASLYSDYYEIGKGPETLMAYGVFDLNATGSSKLLQRGIAMNGSTSIQAVDINAITENVKYSWYTDSSGGRNPRSGVNSAISQKRRVFVVESAALPGTAGRSWTVGAHVGKRRLPSRYFYNGQAQGKGIRNEKNRPGNADVD